MQPTTKKAPPPIPPQRTSSLSAPSSLLLTSVKNTGLNPNTSTGNQAQIPCKLVTCTPIFISHSSVVNMPKVRYAEQIISPKSNKSHRYCVDKPFIPQPN